MAAKAKAKKPVKRRDAKPTRAEKSELNKKLYGTAKLIMRQALHPEPTDTHQPTPEDVDAVLEALMEGDTVRNKCRALAVHPGKVLSIIAADEHLHSRYARARQIQATMFVEQTIDEFDDLRSIDTEADGASVELGIYKHMAAERKWLAGKFHVGAYGDKVTQVHEGNPERPVQHEDLTNLTPEQAAERYQERLRRMREEK